MRQRLPVHCLGFAGVFAERIGDESLERGPNGLTILRGVIHERARAHGHQLRRRPDHLGDALRDLPLPIGPHHKIVSGLRAVRLAEPRELVAARIVKSPDPEPVAEIGDLQHNRIVIDSGVSEAIDHILIGMRHPSFLRRDVVAQHRDVTERRSRQNAADQSWRRSLGEGSASIERIHKRPAPQIRVPRKDRGRCGRDDYAGRNAGDIRGIMSDGGRG